MRQFELLCGEKRAIASERGGSPWARAPSGENTDCMRQFELLCGEKRAIASERGGSPWARAPSGENGPKRGRTADLYTASVALYQLSYRPTGINIRVDESFLSVKSTLRTRTG